MDVKETDARSLTGFIKPRIGRSDGCCEHINESSCST